MQFLILGWLVLDLTDSSSQLGLVIFLYGIANLGLLLFGGIFADRVDRRWLLVGCQSLAVLLIFAVATLRVTDVLTLWHVYAAASILGAVQGLEMPTRMAIVGDLVDRDDVMNAVALNSAMMNAGRIIGPAVAGVIIELTGIGPSLYFNSACYAAEVLFLTMITMSPPKSKRNVSMARALSEGVTYFRTTPLAYTIIGIGFAFGLFAGAYLQVLPAFAKEVLETGAGGVGLLMASAGLGSLVGNIILASLGDFQHRNWLAIGTAVTFGVSMFALAWSPWFWMSFAILVLVGMGSMSYVSLGTTMLMLAVPADLRGRVLSLWSIGAALNYIGALHMAVVADAWGWPVSFTLGGALFLSAVLWLGVWEARAAPSESLRRQKRAPHPLLFIRISQ